MARYVVDAAVSSRARGAFPWSTFVINVTGSLVLGAVAGLALGEVPRAVLGTGFLGGYTTFSTWAYQTVRLTEDGARGPALWNAGGSLLAGSAAAAVGLLATTR
ncbi:MAG: fluoride efflux transporter FluC [Egibacteraceae bacterium]